MLRLLPLLLTAWLASGVSIHAQETDRDALLQRVMREENQVPREVLTQLAAPADARALEDLKKAARKLDSGRALPHCYGRFVVFAGNAELAEEAVEFLVDELNDRKQSIGQYALNALGSLMPTSRVALLKIADKHEHEVFRARALRPLLPHFREHPNKSSLRLLLDHYRLRQSGNGQAFVTTLAAFPLDELSREVEKRLRDRNYPDGSKALVLTALRQPQFSGLVALAEDALTADSDAVARAALATVAAHNGEISPKAWKSLSKGEDPALRLEVMVLRASQEAGRLSVEKDVEQWTRSRDAVRRQAAARALAMRPSAEAVVQLGELVQDNHLPVRLEAVRALGSVRRTDALELLLENVEHRSELTADLVQRTLTALTDQEFGPNRDVWRRWWADHQASFAMPSADVIGERLIALRKSTQGEERTGASFWGMPIVSRRVVFVIDTSGSMLQAFSQATEYGAKEGTRLSAAKAQLLQALRMLPDGTRFNIIAFDRRGNRWADELNVLNDPVRAEAAKWVESLSTGGATNVYDALQRAFELEEVDTIYLLSDGQPVGGRIDDPLLLREEVKAWNATRRIPIHTISLGGDVPLLRRFAEDSGGVFRLVK